MAALKDMLATIPKHKGTEKMQADLKTRLAKMQGALSSGGQGGKRYDPSHVPREGAGQVVLLGAPNAGKSALASALTNAEPEIASYPFTTRVPGPAMMPYENIQFQLVDAPAVSDTFTESWMPNLVRNADLALLVSDAGADTCLENVEAVVRVLSELHVELVECHEPREPTSKVARIPTLLLANKCETEGAEERIEIVEEFYGDRFGSALRVSAATHEGLDALGKELFDLLKIIRVVSKIPGKEPDHSKPFVLAQGATVEEFAKEVHGELAERLRFARIWGGGKFDGQRVQREHVLQDGDVVELHT